MKISNKGGLKIKEQIYNWFHLIRLQVEAHKWKKIELSLNHLSKEEIITIWIERLIKEIFSVNHLKKFKMVILLISINLKNKKWIK